MNKIKAILAWLFFLLLPCEYATAQQYDKVWILGEPMTSMIFEGDSVVNEQLPDTTLQSFITVGDICDSNGNLLFYTNGVNVYNIQGDMMVNGDSLSAPSEYYSQVVQDGMPSREGVVILPKPGDTNLYYIFHYTPTDTLDTNDNAGYESLNLYYSIVDMRQDSGRGAVISKNNPIIQNELLSFSRLAACKHANGRDWWIIKNAWHENIYYEFLLTPDGVAGPFIQQLGPLYGRYNEQPAYASFSPDGSKYASVTGVSDVVLMDFDRCTGLFSNPVGFYNNSYPTNANSISGGVSLAFSPSGRFLYVTCPQEINQYDLSPSRTTDSIRVFTDSITEFYQIHIIQLAPNNKMYISCWNGGSYAIHIINQPDSLGAACDFQFLGQPVFSQSPLAIPYFPNFRLGAVSGSPCDTPFTNIQAIAAAHPAFAQISPNPASDRAEIVYYTGSTTANQCLMYDITGREVWSADASGSAGSINMNLSSFPAGIYIVKFTADGNTLMNTKLVIDR